MHFTSRTGVTSLLILQFSRVALLGFIIKLSQVAFMNLRSVESVYVQLFMHAFFLLLTYQVNCHFSLSQILTKELKTSLSPQELAEFQEFVKRKIHSDSDKRNSRKLIYVWFYELKCYTILRFLTKHRICN